MVLAQTLKILLPVWNFIPAWCRDPCLGVFHLIGAGVSVVSHVLQRERGKERQPCLGSRLSRKTRKSELESWEIFFFTTVQLYTEYRVNKHHDKTGNKEPFEIFKEVEEKGYDQAKCSADKSAKWLNVQISFSSMNRNSDWASRTHPKSTYSDVLLRHILVIGVESDLEKQPH